ncbi:MAG TPA: hypothetical protein VJU61_21910 [Polyangiaceae bacterium]|nr:hypothetical protein [Polyangiaceae bacterium]
MKLKVVVIDLEMPPTLKRWLLRGAVTLSLAGAALAYAAPAHVWSNGETLTAEHLNAAFADLDTRLSAIDGRVGKLEGKLNVNGSAFLATRTTAQDIPHGADTTMVFNEEYFDESDEYDPSTGVFTPKTSGFYEVGCSWEADVASDAGFNFYAEAGIKFGDNPFYVGFYGDAREANRSARTIAKVDAGTPIRCIAYQSSGMTVRSTAQLDTKFEAIRLYQ